MTNFVWDRDPEEAYANPYEYEAQEQFAREAASLLNKYHKYISSNSKRYHRDDTSKEKAIWMLHVDALDALRDCLDLINEKKHRLACRLFRDVIETLDIAAYFSSASAESNSNLIKWFKNEIISHSKYRDFIKKTKGESEAEGLKENYKSLSKFTHRSYRALANSYILGAEDCLVYDGHRDSNILVLPHTISAYYAILANLIKLFSREVVQRGTFPEEINRKYWSESLEVETIQRRFVPHPPHKNT
jgi:hypothetical protein